MYRSDAVIALVLATFLAAPAGRCSETADSPVDYPDRYDVGEPIGAGTRRELFTTIPPDGAGLPPGSGTFESGRGIYRDLCADCHGERMQGTPAGMALIGGRGSLNGDTPKKTVESYWPYATSVFSYIRNTMPLSAPGTLSDDECYALMAYILGSAGIVPTDTIMNEQTLVEIRMPNRDGFVRDNRPDVNAADVD